MDDVAQVAEMVAGGKVLAVTGAGMSTDTGLPDYRGSGGSEDPSVDYDMFLADEMWRRWVWQRNHETWRTLDSLSPTSGHRILASWQERGLLAGIATQNIDGLHAKAGTEAVEMHGSFRSVVCVDCESRFARERLEADMARLNPGYEWDPDPAHAAILATADREKAAASTFTVLPCPACGGILKPDIVFFGEAVHGIPEAFELARQAKTVLVLGSSLLVMTGMWVVTEAYTHGANLAIINRGPTQADYLAHVRIDAGISETLTEVDRLLTA